MSDVIIMLILLGIGLWVAISRMFRKIDELNSYVNELDDRLLRYRNDILSRVNEIWDVVVPEKKQ